MARNMVRVLRHITLYHYHVTGMHLDKYNFYEINANQDDNVNMHRACLLVNLHYYIHSVACLFFMMIVSYDNK